MVDYETKARFIKEEMTIQEIAAFLRTIDETGDKFLSFLSPPQVQIEAMPAMIQALKLARTYLGKAVADGLMQNCVRPPQFALKKIEAALKQAGE